MPIWSTLVVAVVSAFLGFWIAMAIVIMRGEVSADIIQGEGKEHWASMVVKARNLSLLGGLILGVVWAVIYSRRGISPTFWHMMWIVALPSFGWALFYSVLAFRHFLLNYDD
jgi:hypothetical protein